MSRFITQVPADWEVKSVADVYTVNDEVLGSNTPPELRFKYLELELIDTQHIFYEKAIAYTFLEAPGRARRPLKNGDYLFCTVRPNLLGFAKFNPPETDDLWVGSTGLAVARPKAGTSGDFFFQQLLSEIGRRQFHALVTGSNYPAINDSQFKKLELLSPQFEEQKRISSALSLVDAAIEATQASIAAAQKLKRGLMQNLLTGKLKPDGTWRREDEFDIDLKIGGGPKTWGVGRFKDFFVLQRGVDLTDAEHKHGSVPVVKSNGIDGYHEVALVKAPGVTTGRSGTIGQVFYIEEDFWPHNTALYVKDFKGNYPRFCYYLISLMHFDKFSAGTGVPTLNRRDVHAQKICIPDETEQKEICKILDNCDAEIESRKKKFAMLQRFKKSLMQNLLTGKVRIPPDLKIE